MRRLQEIMKALVATFSYLINQITAREINWPAVCTERLIQSCLILLQWLINNGQVVQGLWLDTRSEPYRLIERELITWPSVGQFID